MDQSTKDLLKVAAISLATFAAAVMLQRAVALPASVSMYLPGGRA